MTNRRQDELVDDMRVIEIRKLAAVDMAWLGTRVIIIEYALGIVLPLALGLWSIRLGVGPLASPRQVGFGIWLVSIAANYVPLLIHSVDLARAGTVESEGKPEIVNAGRYGRQQTMILVPFLVVIVALVQHRARAGRIGTKSPSDGTYGSAQSPRGPAEVGSARPPRLERINSERSVRAR